jgi:hypothetical protein
MGRAKSPPYSFSSMTDLGSFRHILSLAENRTVFVSGRELSEYKESEPKGKMQRCEKGKISDAENYLTLKLYS